MHNVTHAAQRMLLIKTASRAFALASVTVLVLACFMLLKLTLLLLFISSCFNNQNYCHS